MDSTTNEKSEKRRKYLEWEARKIAADPLWKINRIKRLSERAAEKYRDDPNYVIRAKQRASERQARRTMTGEHAEYQRQYRDENREHLNAEQARRKRERYDLDPFYREGCKAINRAASKRPETRERLKKYKTEKRLTDPNFRIADNCRRRINDAIAGRNKSASTLELLGCSVLELKKYLESKWTPGMSWWTYGKKGWEIDHIRPCDAFELSDPAQQRACFHHTNLQPMWRELNQSKGNREAPRADIRVAPLVEIPPSDLV